MTDIVERIVSRPHDAPLPTEYLLDEAAAEIERLRKALEPFALNVDAVSLSKALGHISREHLWAARDALRGGQS